MSVTDVPRRPFIRPGATSPVVAYTANVGTADSDTYKQLTASTSVDLVFSHLSVSRHPTSSATDPLTTTLGVGGSGSEAVIAQWISGFAAAASANGSAMPHLTATFPPIIPSGSRLAAKLYTGTGFANTCVIYAFFVDVSQLTYTL